MDKIKPILLKLRKHHFWLLSLIVLITAMVGWFVASGKLSASYTTNKSKIVGKFTNLDGILTTQNHPNSTWTEALGKVTAQEKDIVRTAWETVYNEQKQYLTWPPELKQDFLDFIKNSKPDAEISLDFRTRYQDLIEKSEFPRLLAIVGVTEDDAAKPGTTPAPGHRPGTGVDHDGPQAGGAAQARTTTTADTSTDFVWESSSQSVVKKALYFPNTPSTAQVRQAQEDIWVYRALLQIIRAMNDKQHVPVVKQLTTMQIGKPAAEAFLQGMGPGHIEVLQPGGSAAEMAAAAAAAANVPPAAPPAAAEGGEGAAAATIDEGRYVDADGKALPAGQAAQQQFKRMPVHLKLTIDQRQINKLLVECANSPLPVEVRQLRIGGKENSGNNDGAARAAAAATTAVETHDVPVELHGIIYLYNPPDPTKLGAPPAAGAATAGAPAGGGAPGAM